MHARDLKELLAAVVGNRRQCHHVGYPEEAIASREMCVFLLGAGVLLLDPSPPQRAKPAGRRVYNAIATRVAPGAPKGLGGQAVCRLR